MTKIKNRLKKGFTLVELTIVIAVIAILVAVLVPTFIALIEKANESNDMVLVSNLNTSLSIAGEPDKITVENKDSENVSVYNVTTAITSVRGDGYDVSKLTPTADGGDIVYNASTNKFIYFAEDFTDLAYGDEPSEKDVLVVMDTDLTRVGIAETVLTSNTIQYCVYSENGVNISTSATINIWLYTERGTTTVAAANATIDYFGTADVIDIAEVKGDSFHVYGTAENLSIAKGHVELKSTSKTSSLKITSSDVKLTIVKGAEYEEVAAVNGVSYSLYTKESDDAESQEATDIEATLAEMMGEGSTFVSTLTLSADTTMTDALTVSAGVNKVIDLNGYTLTISTATTENSKSVNIVNNGTLTITDSSAEANGSLIISSADYGIYNAGTLYITGGTIKANKGAVYVNGGTVSMSGGKITTATGVSNSSGYGGIYIYNGEATISGGTITAQRGVYLDTTSASLYMTGGTIESTTYGVYASTCNNLTITGGTVSVTASNSYAIFVTSYSSTAAISNVTITGGVNGIELGGTITNDVTIENVTISGVTEGIIDEHYSGTGKVYIKNCKVSASGCALTLSNNAVVEGGDYTGAGSSSGHVYALYISGTGVELKDGTSDGGLSVNGGLRVDGSCSLTVSGGTFDGSFYIKSSGVLTITGGTFTNIFTNLSNSGTLNINGGKFDEDPTNYVDTANYDVSEQTNNYYTVTAKS